MSFSIELDRTNKTYQPGEKITCKVEITFETPVKVRCIAVRFHGFAATEWSKVKSGRGKKRIKTYAAFEEYFRTYNDLTGERGGKCYCNFLYGVPPPLSLSCVYVRRRKVIFSRCVIFCLQLKY